MASSNITLSAGVRQNLLSLQSTAQLMSATQNRLATGKKVNSALDNPVNFFTSSSLHARANDLSTLLDSMSNGIKTLEAADNALTSITNTVQSMQSTLRQARQDKSFKTNSYTVALGTTPAGTEQLAITGGSVGATAVNVALTGTGTGTAGSFAAGAFTAVDLSAASVSATAATQGFTFGSTMTFDNAGDTFSFGLEFDNSGTVQNISIDATAVTAALGGTTISSAQDLADVINDIGVTGGTVSASGSTLTFTSATTGTTSQIDITSATATNGGGVDTLTNTSGIANTGPVNGTAATGDSINFSLTTEAGTATISLDTSITAVDDSAVTAAELATAINAQANTDLGTTGISYATVGTGGNLEFSSGTTGAASSVAITGFAATGSATTSGIANHAAATGTDAIAAKTVDQLVTDINGNTSLTGKIVASNDNGKLRIQNLSTSDLTVTGLTNGAISGGAGSSTIGGNDVRKTLVSQFNTLLDQLNKTADDASYNGINLLRSDKLKLTLNETGTSTLEIQALDKNGTATSIDAAYLGINGAVNADFDSDATLDSRLDTLSVSLTTLRAQASSFGSNLSIVQNRQDFTKAMITTLQTGGDNLILADTNEEGANLLALQTRQQLSTTALSLSAQADQAVLRLF